MYVGLVLMDSLDGELVEGSSIERWGKKKDVFGTQMNLIANNLLNTRAAIQKKTSGMIRST